MKVNLKVNEDYFNGAITISSTKQLFLNYFFSFLLNCFTGAMENLQTFSIKVDTRDFSSIVMKFNGIFIRVLEV